MDVCDLVMSETFLIIAGVQDIKEKQISLKLCIAYGIVGILLYISNCIYGNKELWQLGIALLPGVGMIVISYMTKERIGIGDGVVMVIMGLFFSYEKIISILVMGIMFSTLVSLYLLVVKKVSKEYEIPFVPFLLMASVVVVMGGFK